jgi:hypothetical protein
MTMLVSVRYCQNSVRLLFFGHEMVQQVGVEENTHRMGIWLIRNLEV